MSGLFQVLEAAVEARWTGIYLRVLAAVLAYGASVHAGNMLGVGHGPWGEMPVHWRVMDVILLVFNVTVAYGLWMKQPWAVLAFVGGVVLLQIVPYTVFRQHFVQTAGDTQTLNGLIGMHLILLAVLAGLVVSRK